MLKNAWFPGVDKLYQRPIAMVAQTIVAFVHVTLVNIIDLFHWLFLAQHKNVRGQTIVITGAAQGIGRALAERLACKHGARVCLLDVNEVWTRAR
jgi:FlaA1/EpsC-like NDP-sugar epimerase